MKKKIRKPVGQRLSPVLEEIEDMLWEFELFCPGIRPKYTTEGFRASIKIFASGLLDKMWIYEDKNKVPLKDRKRCAEKAGQDIRKIVKKYTGIDNYDLYNKKKK